MRPGDWRGIGVADGIHGYAANRLDDHVKACAEHGITPNRELYEAGRAEGLKVYCRLDRAADEGLANKPNYQVCSGELAVSFNLVYYEGRAGLHRAPAHRGNCGQNRTVFSASWLGEADADTRRSLVRDAQDLGDDIADQQRVVDRMREKLNRLVEAERQRLSALGIDA